MEGGTRFRDSGTLEDGFVRRALSLILNPCIRDAALQHAVIGEAHLVSDRCRRANERSRSVAKLAGTCKYNWVPPSIKLLQHTRGCSDHRDVQYPESA